MLPLELLELIVNATDPAENGNEPGFTHDLSSCLFVSRDFRHCVLRRFYRQVRIYRPARIATLLDLIVGPASSRLGSVGRYVRSLYIYVDFGWSNAEKTVELPGNNNLVSLIHALQSGEQGGLEYFSVVIPRYCERMQITLPRLDNILTLRELFYRLHHTQDNGLHLSSLLELFNIKYPMESFEKLSLRFDLGSLPSEDLVAPHSGDHRWGILDELLSSERFPRLLSVQLSFSVVILKTRINHRIRTSEIQAILRTTEKQFQIALCKQFDKLSSSKRISFSVDMKITWKPLR